MIDLPKKKKIDFYMYFRYQKQKYYYDYHGFVYM